MIVACIGALRLGRRRWGAGASDSGSPCSESSSKAAAIVFENVIKKSGIRFTLKNSVSPQRYSIETMTGGVALFDYDNDGLLDIFFTNGAAIPSLEKTDASFSNRLFHNNGDGTFTDVTQKAGLAGIGYSMGVAAGDYDNDGFVDLYVTGFNRNQLLHNNGDGTFTRCDGEGWGDGHGAGDRQGLGCGRLDGLTTTRMGCWICWW